MRKNPNKTKSLKFATALFALVTLISSCSNPYIKTLEQIVVENQGTINFKLQEGKKQDERKEKRKRISFEHFDRYLITASNAGIHLEVYKSEKPFANILVLPTLGEPASSLDKFSQEIASYGYNVHALDVEGFGKSSGEEGNIDVKKVEQDISTAIEYIKSRNDGKIVLSGTSMGSEYSLLYSAEGKYRDKLDAIIAHGSFVPSADVPDFDVRIWFCRNPLNKPLVEFFSGGKLDVVETLGRKNFYNNLEELSQMTEDPCQRVHINTGGYIDFLNYKPENLINSYKAPILFIVSKDDGMIPFKHSIRVFDFFRKTNPNAVLYIPQGEERKGEVPHMAFDTNSKEISSKINAFLRKVLK